MHSFYCHYYLFVYIFSFALHSGFGFPCCGSYGFVSEAILNVQMKYPISTNQERQFFITNLL